MCKALFPFQTKQRGREPSDFNNFIIIITLLQKITTNSNNKGSKHNDFHILE